MRRRLQQAALELYGEQGFERTTAAEIAARVGVTERTFFRHFADKREVLFDGEAVLRDLLVTAVAQAPAGLGPLATLALAFQAAEPLLEANRPFSQPRQAVIAAVPALKERELAKVASLVAALAAALAQRGVPERLATLAAQTGMTVFAHAVGAWLGDPSRTLGDHLADALDDLGRSPPPSRSRPGGEAETILPSRPGDLRWGSAGSVERAGPAPKRRRSTAGPCGDRTGTPTAQLPIVSRP